MCRRLAADDVVYVHHFGSTRVYPHLVEDRHQPSGEGVELLLRVAHRADLHLVARTEANLELKPIGWLDSVGDEAGDYGVVLIRGQCLRRKPCKNAHRYV